MYVGWDEICQSYCKISCFKSQLCLDGIYFAHCTSANVFSQCALHFAFYILQIASCTGMWSRKTSWLVCLALPIRRSFTWWSANGIMMMIVLVWLKWSKWNYDMRDNILSTKFQKQLRWTSAWRHPSKMPKAAIYLASSKICSQARQGTPSSCSKAILE